MIHQLIIKAAFFFLLVSSVLTAQPYIFFNDSPNSDYYPYSQGEYTSPSIVILTNGDKLPVDVSRKYSGLNALRLRWVSGNGDWNVSISSDNFIPRDATLKDSITFRVFALASIDSAFLPAVFLEDFQNNQTEREPMAGYLNLVPANEWIRVSIPLDAFFQSPGNADLTQITGIGFGQNNPDGNIRTIYLDEIRMISDGDNDITPPAVPAGLTAEGFHTVIELGWTANAENDLAGYRLYRSDGGDFQIIASLQKDDTSYTDHTGAPPKTFSYKISSFDSSLNESQLSDAVTASTTSLPDTELLDSVQRATFRYFWDFAHPVSGLARDRSNGNNETVTSGGSGFGVMAIMVGIERGYITRQQGIDRMLTILNFLTNSADRFHGAYPHWLNGTTGDVIPFSQYDNGGDLVETAYLIQGLLAARQYFSQNTTDEEQIRTLITNIWEGVEWDWYRKDNGNFLYWHWSPNYGWIMNFPIQGPNETMITYLLAIASPTHSVPASLYHLGWASSPNYINGNFYYGIPLYVGVPFGGPLFFVHYSFLGFDPRNKKDDYTNYFINNRNQTLINRAYCIDNPHNYTGYDEDTWGLTACDGPFGYNAFSPTNDNGTIAPTAALSSMPYTPAESIAAMKSFFYEYGNNLWGTYGFKDAFNLAQNWYAGSYLAIDEGPIIIMIENYRTQLLWNNFMANPEIQPMLDAIGFVPDYTAAESEVTAAENYILMNNYPNPFNPSTHIKFHISESGLVTLKVYDVLGNEIKTLINGDKSAGDYSVVFDGKDLPSGIYFYVLNAGGKTISRKMCLLK